MFRQGSNVIKLLDTYNFILVNRIEQRFHKSRSNNSKNVFQQGHFINKIMSRDEPKKFWYPTRSPRNESIKALKEKLVNPHVTRRKIVLNKLFMKHITDLMASGDIITDLLGRGVEVSRVDFTNDFKIVRVFWFSSYTDILDETSALLKKISYKLRHELTQLRVIGVVPLIQFVRDDDMKKMVDLEKKFLEADYGNDYEPKITIAPKRQLTLYTQLPKEVQERIRKMDCVKNEDEDNECEDDEEIYDVDLPPMKHDTLAFDHSVIMSTITASLNKARGKPFNQSIDTHLFTPEIIEIEFNKKYSNILSSKEEDETFMDFLAKQKIKDLQKRKLRAERFENMEEYEECYSDEESDSDDFDYDDFKNFENR